VCTAVAGTVLKGYVAECLKYVIELPQYNVMWSTTKMWSPEQENVDMKNNTFRN